MIIEPSEYTGHFATLRDGSRFRIYERNGRLEITAHEGGLTVVPTASNVIELEIRPNFPGLDRCGEDHCGRVLTAGGVCSVHGEVGP